MNWLVIFEWTSIHPCCVENVTHLCGLLPKNPTQRERDSTVSLRSSQKDQGHQTREVRGTVSARGAWGDMVGTSYNVWHFRDVVMVGGVDMCSARKSVWHILDAQALSALVARGKQAGREERIAIPISRGSSPPRVQTCVSCLCRQIIYCWVTRKATPELLVFNSEIHSGIFSARIWCLLVLSCLHLSTWRMSVLSGMPSYMNAVPCDAAQECALRIWDSWYRRDLQGHNLTLHLQETSRERWRLNNLPS